MAPTYPSQHQQGTSTTPGTSAGSSSMQPPMHGQNLQHENDHTLPGAHLLRHLTQSFLALSHPLGTPSDHTATHLR